MDCSGSESQLRRSIAHQLAQARCRTDELFALLRSDALWDRPIPERHRIIFYLGHLEAFDWNLICRDSLGFTPFRPEFDRLFAFGIDPVDGKLPADQPADWPALAHIQTYNAEVRRLVDEAVRRGDLGESAGNLRDGWAFNIAIEHRLMHAETLAYMLHWLPLERKVAPPAAELPAESPAEFRMIEIPAGRATLGIKRSQHPTLGWDNEYEEHLVDVPAFAIDRFKVTNGEFLKFVRAGGYQNRSFWTEEAWQWIGRQGVSHPLFWTGAGDQWRFRTMFSVVPLPLSWPVYVSHAEASAYSKWKRMQLPTEAQLHRAAYGTPHARERSYPWGEDPPSGCHGNFDFKRWDPAPVGSYPAGDSAFGVSGLLDNGWEWTSTIFGPFDGFERLPIYPGYSADFFDGKHYLMKGGSSRTAARLLRRSFRNWFQPHYPYIYCGFRCVAG
jgi:ergothioneine biosynthesis protein EgtB